MPTWHPHPLERMPFLAPQVPHHALQLFPQTGARAVAKDQLNFVWTFALLPKEKRVKRKTKCFLYPRFSSEKRLSWIKAFVFQEDLSGSAGEWPNMSWILNEELCKHQLFQSHNSERYLPLSPFSRMRKLNLEMDKQQPSVTHTMNNKVRCRNRTAWLQSRNSFHNTTLPPPRELRSITAPEWRTTARWENA